MIIFLIGILLGCDENRHQTKDDKLWLQSKSDNPVIQIKNEVDNSLTKYYLTKLYIFGIVTLSSIFFSTGLHMRVKKFDCDFYRGERKINNKSSNQNKTKDETPTGTYPGFLLQLAILLSTCHHFGDKNTIIKNIKIFLQIFAISGYAFALGTTNMSELMKKRMINDKY